MPLSVPPNPPRPLDALEATIRQRAADLGQSGPSEKSYTARLLGGDHAKLCGKVTEEAAELVEAATLLDSTDTGADPAAKARAHFVYEAGDLVYHTLVLLRRHGVDLADVEAELARRFGVSGLEEKASRNRTAADRPG